jgi:hypothetical protein
VGRGAATCPSSSSVACVTTIPTPATRRTVTKPEASSCATTRMTAASGDMRIDVHAGRDGSQERSKRGSHALLRDEATGGKSESEQEERREERPRVACGEGTNRRLEEEEGQYAEAREDKLDEDQSREGQQGQRAARVGDPGPEAAVAEGGEEDGGGGAEERHLLEDGRWAGGG